MFYISDSDSDHDDYPSSSFNNSRSKQAEPDISGIISNPFSQKNPSVGSARTPQSAGGSSTASGGQMDALQQQRLARMKQAAQRQSSSHMSMSMTSSGMRSSHRNSTTVQSFDNYSNPASTPDSYLGSPGIRDETRRPNDFEEYTLRDDDDDRRSQREKKPRFSVPNSSSRNVSSPSQIPPANTPPAIGEEIVPASALASGGNTSSPRPMVEENKPASDLEEQLKSRGMSAAVYEPAARATPVPPQEQAAADSRPRGRPELDLSDRRQFLNHAVPKEYGMVKCYIQRERGKLKLFPKYHLYFENGNKFLLSARKRKKNRSSNYLLSLEKGDLTRDSPHYFGKLRANFLGTEFTIFDDGASVNKSKDPRNVRHELGAILYETNILGTKGPRRLNIITPAVGPDGEFITYSQMKGNPSLVQTYKEGKRSNIHVFTNKRPSWNEKLKAYVLNFNGRVTKASVKNFQLVEEGDNDTVMLQFGKVSDNRFSLDFRYPLSAAQAFAIALSAYDFKLMCE